MALGHELYAWLGQLPVLQCPSDTGVPAGGIGLNNYRFAWGRTISGNDYQWNAPNSPQTGIFAGLSYAIRNAGHHRRDQQYNRHDRALRRSTNKPFRRAGNVAQVGGFSNPDVSPVASNPGVIACAATLVRTILPPVDYDPDDDQPVVSRFALARWPPVLLGRRYGPAANGTRLHPEFRWGLVVDGRPPAGTPEQCRS